jgi:hypothetical protein
MVNVKLFLREPLERKLSDYQCYYNQSRTHSSRNGATPVEENERQVIEIDDYRWQRHCRGLMELPIAA